MKKLVGLMLLIPVVCFAQESYSKVEEKLAITQAVEQKFTLEEIDDHIARLNGNIAYAQERIADFQAEKAIWEKRKLEAGKLGVIAVKVQENVDERK